MFYRRSGGAETTEDGKGEGRLSDNIASRNQHVAQSSAS